MIPIVRVLTILYAHNQNSYYHNQLSIHMNIVMKFAFIFVVVPAFVELFAAAVEDNIGQVCADSTTSRSAEQDDDALTPQLIDWLRDNGAYINEKLVIKQFDPSFPRGIYALEDMEKGETVCKIPWALILKPNHYEHVHVKAREELSDCGTIESVYHAITAERDEMTPYGKYLLNQPQAYTAAFWSQVSLEGASLTST
jgi:hypothetical protein